MRLSFMAWLALLAVLVQCLLPVSNALAMSRATQAALEAPYICSFHSATSAVDPEQDKASPLSGKFGFCPMCQIGGMGHALALPTLAPQVVRLDISPLILGKSLFREERFSASPHFNLATPRGPPPAA